MNTFRRHLSRRSSDSSEEAAATAAAAASGDADPASEPHGRRDRESDPGDIPAGRGCPHLRRVTLLTAVVAAGYAAYSLLRFHTFRTSVYDLVIFDQAVRSYSRFEPGTALVKGVHNGFGPDFSVMGDHFSPMLAVLAPLYWIWDDPRTLLLAQAVLLAAAIPPLWVYTRRALGVRAAYLIVLAYALSWPIAETIAFDFHEAAFVPLLTAVLLERHQAGRWSHVALAVVALLLVKEDMGLLVAGFGLYLLTRGGERLRGGVLLVVGVAMTWLASRVLIPAFGGDPNYYWAYDALGPDVPGVLVHAATRPWDVALQLGTPPVKLQTMALLLVPLVLAPLGSPLALAALPLVLERMLASSYPNWWEPHFHYNAFIVVVLFAAGVDAVRRLRERRDGDRPARPEALRWYVAWWPSAVLAAALALVPFFAFERAANPAFYRRDERGRAAAAAVAHVPDGVLVEAANYVGPHLSGRTRVLLWDAEPRWAPWVVADVGRWTFPFTSLTHQQACVDLLRSRGYRTIFQRSGYVVLHRPGPDPVLKGNR